MYEEKQDVAMNEMSALGRMRRLFMIVHDYHEPWMATKRELKNYI